MAGALDGVKILGFTHFAQAPFALQLLGDLGADVINIERPGTGDFNRSFQSEEKLGGESPFFLAMNRNKRSLALNLKHPEAKEIVYKLLKETDVVVTNYRPGSLDKLGFGYEDAKKINPRIVYCEAIGYGSSGPYAKLPGQDLLGQSLSGFCSIVGPDQDGRPVAGGIYVVDMYSSMLLTVGLLSALISAKQTGIGQRVEVNLLNSGIHMQSQEISYYLNTGKKPQRPKTYSGHYLQEAPYGIYKTRNGWMSFATNMVDNAEWKIQTMEEILGIENLAQIMPDRKAMLEDRDHIHSVLEAALVKQDTEYWLEKFQAVGFWCAKVNDYEDVAKDPQVIHNGIIKEIQHPVAGTYKAIGTPIEMSETPPTIRRPAPLLGEHNEEILKHLGYTAEQINSMRESKLF